MRRRRSTWSGCPEAGISVSAASQFSIRFPATERQTAMKFFRRRILWIVPGLLLLLIGASAFRLTRQIQHRQRDEALIEAVKQQKTLLAIDLMKQGADANVRDRGEKPHTLWQLLCLLWQRKSLAASAPA